MITIKIIAIFFLLCFWIITHIAIGSPKLSEKEFDLLTDNFEFKQLKGTKIYKSYPIKNSLKIGEKIYRNYEQYENEIYTTHEIVFFLNSLLLLICTNL